MRSMKTGICEAHLLDASVAEDRAEWVSLWNVSKFRRPHDHPGFLEATRSTGERPMAVACLAGAHLLSLYPFNVLDLAQLPFARQFSDAPGVDVISPYGYGGATCEDDANRQGVEEALEQALSEFFVRMNVVSEFVREDLFQQHLIPRRDSERLVVQPNIVVDLRVSPEERWQRYSPKVRRYMCRAAEAGIRIRIGDADEYLEPFIDVYYGTMKRQNASGYYFFAKEDLRRLHDSLKPSGGIQYALASLEDRVISAQLLLFSTDTMYSFLSGTDETYFKLRPFEFLKQHVITWGHEHGYASFVLGGGLKPNDGLFQFKRKFEPRGLMDFCVRRIVWDRERYDSLVAAREAWEVDMGRVWRPEPDFFPAYRAHSMVEETTSPPTAA